MQSQNDIMICVGSHSKPFSITIILVCAPTTSAEETEIKRFYESLQDLLELTPK